MSDPLFESSQIKTLQLVEDLDKRCKVETVAVVTSALCIMLNKIKPYYGERFERIIQIIRDTPEPPNEKRNPQNDKPVEKLTLTDVSWSDEKITYGYKREQKDTNR